MASSTIKSRIYAAVEMLDPALLKLEPELIGLKWPPYRPLTPVEASQKFAKVYGEIWRERYPGDHVTGIDPDLFEAERPGQPTKAGRLRERTSIHKARQRADRTGLDYRTFIQFCNRFALGRKVKRLPRPNQLLSEKYSAAFEHKLAAFIKEHKPVEVLGATISKIPGCIGHPGAYHARSPVCGSCRYLSKCGKACRAITADFQKKDADKANPKSWAARERAKNRVIVASWRVNDAKKKKFEKKTKIPIDASLKPDEEWTS